ncbi:hypothetical protein BDE27_3276 [Xenorhabdus ehlersii]|uniref:Uncharacterized protein n=1 Tax=Xenorhabdus ehlersii TaxID=290111 RepID=A0A2D0IWC3_9GAMM|nr:hypothetical protein [Xenorhabdus sp. TS4]PHM26077.1 hypothetical protein Xehl_01139 [Xenorhabdus ehlersii]RKE88633.1 hypothetical protein BDE27_3276 [Xenorhabdus ehlersii]
MNAQISIFMPDIESISEMPLRIGREFEMKRILEIAGNLEDRFVGKC